MALAIHVEETLSAPAVKAITGETGGKGPTKVVLFDAAKKTQTNQTFSDSSTVKFTLMMSAVASMILAVLEAMEALMKVAYENAQIAQEAIKSGSIATKATANAAIALAKNKSEDFRQQETSAIITAVGSGLALGVAAVTGYKAKWGKETKTLSSDKDKITAYKKTLGEKINSSEADRLSGEEKSQESLTRQESSRLNQLRNYSPEKEMLGNTFADTPKDHEIESTLEDNRGRPFSKKSTDEELMAKISLDDKKELKTQLDRAYDNIEKKLTQRSNFINGIVSTIRQVADVTKSSGEAGTLSKRAEIQIQEGNNQASQTYAQYTQQLTQTSQQAASKTQSDEYQQAMAIFQTIQAADQNNAIRA